MVDYRKIFKHADIFADLAGVENMLWDGAPPIYNDQSIGNFLEQPHQVNVQLSKNSINIISKLQPVFQEQAAQLILRGLRAGLRPEIVEGYRTQERQNELYEQGRSQSGQVVTKTKKSMHTQGLAIDIAQLDENGNITYDASPGFWEEMGAIGKSLGMIWGGDWKSIQDKPHFQYRVNKFQ